MSEPNMDTVIVDQGSGYWKIGFSGDDAPREKVPCIIGVPRAGTVNILGDENSEYVGEQAVRNGGILNLIYPIKEGIISDEKSVSSLYEYIISNLLRVDPTLVSLLTTEAPSNPKSNRKKIFRILFELIGVAKAQCQIQGVLALYASGRTTGMVIDSGDGVTHSLSIYEGYAVKGTVSAAKIAGRHVTEFLKKALRDYNSFDLENEANSDEVVKKIKEKTCRCALSYEKEFNDYVNGAGPVKEYSLPDGAVLNIGAASIVAPEILFTPGIGKYKAKTMKEMLSTTYQETNIENRMAMISNAVLSGGTTLLEGYEKRSELELKDILPENAKPKVKITAENNRGYSVFVGGSILSSLSTFQTLWIEREEYLEDNNCIFGEKCLF